MIYQSSYLRIYIISTLPTRDSVLILTFLL
nr:MAG TPA: hypothetical protein [Caudoviricetes sp.]